MCFGEIGRPSVIHMMALWVEALSPQNVNGNG